MCLSPSSIPNPNRGSKNPFVLRTKDTESARIYVPCRHCAECRKQRQMHLVQRCQAMLLDHHMFFATLTYNNESLPSITSSTGYIYRYADIRHLQLAIKRIRKNNLFTRPFSYLAVSERGSKGGRPHFHVMFFVAREIGDNPIVLKQLEHTMYWSLRNEWRIFTGTRRKTSWKPLFTYKERFHNGRLEKNYDLHYVDPALTTNGIESVAYYVTKYCLKSSPKERRLQQALRLNLSEDEYNDIWSIIRSKFLISKHFGCATEHEWSMLRTFIESSRNNSTGFKFISRSGQTYNLARYYYRTFRTFSQITPFGDIINERKPIITAHDVICSVDARGGPYVLPRARTRTEINNIIERENRQQVLIFNRDDSYLCQT